MVYGLWAGCSQAGVSPVARDTGWPNSAPNPAPIGRGFCLCSTVGSALACHVSDAGSSPATGSAGSHAPAQM